MFKISTAVAGRFFFQWGQSLLYSVQCTVYTYLREVDSVQGEGGVGSNSNISTRF